MCVCIHKYNLLSLYNITCVYIFMTEYLVWDDQSVCFSLGKTISPAFSVLYLPLVLFVGLRPRGLFPILFNMPIAVALIQPVFKWSCWWDFMGVAFDSP